jgi:hypothetical protein
MENMVPAVIFSREKNAESLAWCECICQVFLGKMFQSNELKENDVDQFKLNLLLMIFWMNIINYNSQLNLIKFKWNDETGAQLIS